MSGIGLGGGQERLFSGESGTPAGQIPPEFPTNAAGADGAAQREIERLQSALERKNKEVDT